MKNELGDCTKRLSLCLRASASGEGCSRSTANCKHNRHVSPHSPAATWRHKEQKKDEKKEAKPEEQEEQIWTGATIRAGRWAARAARGQVVRQRVPRPRRPRAGCPAARAPRRHIHPHTHARQAACRAPMAHQAATRTRRAPWRTSSTPWPPPAARHRQPPPRGTHRHCSEAAKGKVKPPHGRSVKQGSAAVSTRRSRPRLAKGANI